MEQQKEHKKIYRFMDFQLTEEIPVVKKRNWKTAFKAGFIKVNPIPYLYHYISRFVLLPFGFLIGLHVTDTKHLYHSLNNLIVNDGTAICIVSLYLYFVAHMLSSAIKSVYQSKLKLTKEKAAETAIQLFYIFLGFNLTYFIWSSIFKVIIGN